MASLVAHPGPVLLVEPYLPLARPLLRGLDEEGFVAHLARDDEEADARARAGGYAALLVDFKVPRRGGAALVRGWRRRGLLAPVLMLVPAGGGDVLEAVEAGADDCLGLPFCFEDLVGRLWAWLRPGDAACRRGAPPAQQQEPQRC